MKNLKFLLSLLLVLAVFFGLNTKFGSIPPIGKFLDPVHGAWQNEHSETGEDKELVLEGLNEAVSISYDAQLIPHIFAQNDTDLYKAQGYITAKHRLWQMEFQTHAAAGRVSEIVGDAALEFDRAQRRKGMVFGAENSLIKMQEDPETMSFLEAYKEGVNAYIDQLKPKDYPVEYKLLDYSPEPWTIKKTALLLMYMTDMLAGGDSDLEYTNFLNTYGKERFDLFYPDFFDIVDPVIPKEVGWDHWQVTLNEVPTGSLPQDYFVETMEKPHPDNGSNNWAVGPQKSYSGNAILANDPHLGLKLPSIWFAMQLATPSKNTYGATLPGALGIIIGFNNDISWGVTNATRDVKDWYKIQFSDATRTKYHYDGQLKDSDKRIEAIRVRNKATVYDTVIYTHHGPVSYDVSFKGNEQKVGYAMKWVGHIGGNNQRTFLDLNKAKNYEDYTLALTYYVAPAQNFIFSSKDGDIALWIQGKFPNKWKGQGKFLLDGSRPDHEWQNFIPQEYNAQVKNPSQGFVSSANQHPTDESYPYYVFNDGYETYRNRVINDFFRSKEKFNVQDFKDLHNNNYNLMAAELLPHMFLNMDTSLLSATEKQFLEEIKTWDFFNDIEKSGPSIWEAWWQKLKVLLWDEFEGGELAMDPPFNYQAIYLLKNYPEDDFMDLKSTPEKETAKELFVISFKEAVNDLEKWKQENGSYNWGAYKATFVGHLLQALPAFSRFNLPIGGNKSVVNATSKDHGPSWRMIVEMSTPPKAWGIYPGGQSGNPGSKYYDDFIDRWAAGDYLELNFMQDKNQTEGIIFTQTLSPSK
ncbi:Acyl-homoserine lactone acylase QuiP [Arenibacter antarcticus]|uniref:Penicillin acylase family protein n=1 Tax=Arenibacter antarcticus TaxID=2040469 RepID=A0ABW5VD24_9FLAO|nr:penicillin acylase family protein [Arenibacter sp. H213]MCM4169604.1 penicillin acylase family protein [Arenibacter sp. H213]